MYVVNVSWIVWVVVESCRAPSLSLNSVKYRRTRTRKYVQLRDQGSGIVVKRLSIEAMKNWLSIELEDGQSWLGLQDLLFPWSCSFKKV